MDKIEKKTVKQTVNNIVNHRFLKVLIYFFLKLKNAITFLLNHVAACCVYPFFAHLKGIKDLVQCLIVMLPFW